MFELVTERDSPEEIEAAARKLITAARKHNWNVAADNLEYFLSGKHPERTLPRRWLRSFRLVRAAEKLNLMRFQREILEQIQGLKKMSSKTFEDYWDHLISYGNAGYSTEELFYACGDSTLTSNGRFAIKIDSNNHAVVQGVVNHVWWDRYDFHYGKGVFIPGYGKIPDAAMIKLVRTGRARNYKLTSKWSHTLNVRLSKDSKETKWNWELHV